MATAKKSGYDKLKEDIQDEKKLMATCKLKCDEALIKFYETNHEVIAEYDDAKSKLDKCLKKISSMEKDEVKIIKDWLSNYDQLKTVAEEETHKLGLMQIAIKNKLGDFTGKQNWTYSKVKDLFSGMSITNGYVEAKEVMDKMAAQSADIVVKRLGLLEAEIQGVRRKQNSDEEMTVKIKLDDDGKIQKQAGKRTSYRFNIDQILKRCKQALLDQE